MGWHYQVRKRNDGYFDVVEVYEHPRGWTCEGCDPFGDSYEEVVEDLERMLKDAKAYPVLDEAGEQGGQHGPTGE